MKKIILIIQLIAGIFFGYAYAQTDTIPPATPINIVGIGYEKDITVDWYHNTEPDLAGYKIYGRSGNNFTLITSVPKEKSFYTSSVPIIGLTRYYKVSAYDNSGNESALSDSVACTSHNMTDEEFLDMVERATFRYFYDFGHPVSGLSRERNTSGNTVTSGGSGFGLMALLVGIERGYISRDEGTSRLLKILTFLYYTADRFHGAFSHWLNGETGVVIPFSTYDNGGDLVETSYMMQGLYTVRQYFSQPNSLEDSIRTLSTKLINEVEYDWYRRTTSSNFLYWHWSPNYGWQMNMRIQGPNECMIVYLLGIASTTHGVPASLFHNGWASSTYYRNTKSFYGYRIWVGWDYGGPLFFSHYSFLGFDPRNKKDIYANYYNNGKNISLIHKAYCTANPHSFTGYGPNCWGLTASDDPTGYRVHEPTNDNGTITPSAALSSLAYTPQESIEVIKHLYRTYGSEVWGEYGFYDAFNPKENWYADSYLAIDQGPIIVMIENYRTGLLWNLFMANPEIQPMLDAIGFVPDSTTNVDEENYDLEDFNLVGNYPNPFNPNTTIVFNLPARQNVTVTIYNQLGEKINEILNNELPAGENKIVWNGLNSNNNQVSSGVYLYKVSSVSKSLYGKMILQK